MEAKHDTEVKTGTTTQPEKKEEEKGAPEEKKPEEHEIESNWEEKVDSFDELHLKEELLRGIYGYGFTKPSPIQQKGILPLLKRRDTIAQVPPLIILICIGPIRNWQDGHFCHRRSTARGHHHRQGPGPNRESHPRAIAANYPSKHVRF